MIRIEGIKKKFKCNTARIFVTIFDENRNLLKTVSFYNDGEPIQTLTQILQMHSNLMHSSRFRFAKDNASVVPGVESQALEYC